MRERRRRQVAEGKKYRSPNRDETLRRYNLKRDYNMTPEEWDDIFERQGGRCAICREPSVGQRLAIDHDHHCCPVPTQRSGGGTCGKCTRGLLCFSCNRALGGFGDNPTKLDRAASYLRGEVDWAEEEHDIISDE